MTLKTVHGSGGGGGKGGGGAARVPVEDKDSLQSKAFAQVLDLICEGEIEGLVDGLRSVYLDGTPIENENGTLNFSGVVFETREGTQDQDYLTNFSATENEVAVGVEITKTDTVDGSVTRTITNESIDAIRVRISVPQLSFLNNQNGDLKGSEVEYFIEVQSDGGGFQEVIRDRIIGKSTSKYERQYRVELEGPGPWDVRVSRETKSSENSRNQNRTIWESYTEIVDGKLRYPNSALCAIRIDSKQFSSIPTRGYDCKLIKVRIPSNATVRPDGSLTYFGIWDGTFQVAWSSNPAWCFYDLLTNTRYGLGSFINEDLIDKWALYSIGQYCDELVPNGFGGTEPRFSCNVYFQSRAEAFKVLQDFVSIFRSMLFWAEGTITAVQDSPSDPAHIFTPANVLDGLFTYSGSSAKARHTVALVTWADPSDLYKQKVEYVEDSEAIARYGVIETSITAIGCTSQGQARRLGAWLLYSERYQTELVVFRTGLQGAVCRPGQIIKIADPVRAGSRRGGRIVSATTTVVTVDQTLSISAPSHTLSIMLPDGSVETRQLLSVDGRLLTVATPFSTAAANAAVWMVQSSDIEAQLFKIVTITESEDGTHEIGALAHDPQKYDAIEQGLKIEPRSISSLTGTPSAPSGLAITETLYSVGSDVRAKVTVSWNYVSGATSYVVQYTIDGGNVTQVETSSNEIEILSAVPGVYVASVFAINSIGLKSTSATATREVRGRTAPPGNVLGFSLIPMAGTAYLSWNQSIDLDVLIGGSVRIRYSPDVLDPVWRSAVDIMPALPGNTTRVPAPLLPGAYMAKFVDSSGVASMEEALIITTVPAPTALNVVELIDEAPAFNGAKTSMFVTEAFGDPALTLSPEGTVDDIILIDSVILWDQAGGTAPEGFYDFENIVDLGQNLSSRVTANIKAAAVDVAETIDARANLIDDWLDLDGEFIDDVNAELFLKTTEDDPGDIGAVWTEWKRFFVGEYLARGYQFQLRATSDNVDHNIIVSGLSVTIDVPDRVVNLAGLQSGADTYSVVFDGAFMETPAIGITAYDMQTGDYYEITAETREGFDIVFKDSSGTDIDRKFDVLAKGYGRQVA